MTTAILVLSGSTVLAQRDQYDWQQMQDYSFNVAAGGTLQVRVDDADLAVLSTDGPTEIVIRLRSNEMAWAAERFERMNFRARVDGDTVVVESDEEDERGGWVAGRWMSVQVEARIPSRFDLDLVTQDGDVSLASFEGDAVVRSQDGDLTVDELSGDSIELRTQDGDVSAALLAGSRIEAHSQDGDINVDAVRGVVSMHTSDGDIRIGTADGPEIELGSSDGDLHVAINDATRMNLETHDGDISIEAPSSLSADIDFAGEDVYVAGGFRIDGRISEGRAAGTINGGGERIRARTGDGTVRLIENDRR